MLDDPIPNRIKTTLAAAIVSLTPEVIRRRACEAGLTADLNDHPRWWVEDILGRPLTAEDYLKADRKLDPRRAVHKRYNAKRATR